MVSLENGRKKNFTTEWKLSQKISLRNENAHKTALPFCYSRSYEWINQDRLYFTFRRCDSCLQELQNMLPIFNCFLRWALAGFEKFSPPFGRHFLHYGSVDIPWYSSARQQWAPDVSRVYPTLNTWENWNFHRIFLPKGTLSYLLWQTQPMSEPPLTTTFASRRRCIASFLQKFLRPPGGNNICYLD